MGRLARLSLWTRGFALIDSSFWSRERRISQSDIGILEAEAGQRNMRRSRSSNVGSKDSELWNMVLLVILYMIQGVPLGLTMGAMPFLLQSKASYTQIGIFSVASYPYSFKLFWSPIVDSVYSLSIGRRKSWIIPLQFTSALLLMTSAGWAEERLARADVVGITALFFLLVLLAATQDIAVDGWALTLLSKKHVGYASTCQTIGMNLGYFTSFTVFLALNDADFCNKFLRDPGQHSKVGFLPLKKYMMFWGMVYLVITICVWLFKTENNFQALGEAGENVPELKERVSLREAYSQLWAVVRLPSMRVFSVILITCRLGMLPAEQAAPLKLLDKGVSKEALAGLVLLEFPCEMLSAVLAGRWAHTSSPFVPWMYAYRIRLVMAVLTTTVVVYFPRDAKSLSAHPQEFLLLAGCGLITSFTSTLMFTALGSFFNRISDPTMGGAYLTLLNTIANMGVTLPKLGMFAAMDFLTTRSCQGLEGDYPSAICPHTKSEAEGVNACTALGGECVVVRDGFYPLAYGMAVLGLVMGLVFQRILPELEQRPLDVWRARTRKKR